MDEQKDNQGPAEPGRPLEPDELETPGRHQADEPAPDERPPELESAPRSQRQEEKKAGHPSEELDIRTGQKGGRPGKASAGAHPTSELDIRRGRRS